MMHPPPYSFNAVFDEYNFSTISNLFDNNHLCALSTHKLKMCDQNVSYLVKDLELEAKKLNRICHKNCSKSAKMAITVSKFLKTFRGSIPLDPLEPDFCSSICFKLTFRKKIRIKNVKILCHPPPP